MYAAQSWKISRLCRNGDAYDEDRLRRYRIQGGPSGCAGNGRSNKAGGRSEGEAGGATLGPSPSRLSRTTSPPITSQSRKFFRADFGWRLWHSVQDRTRAKSAETALN